MGYVFRPSKVMADKIAEVVRDLQCDLPNVNISTFLDFSIERAMEDCRCDRERLLGELKSHLAAKQTGAKEGL